MKISVLVVDDDQRKIDVIKLELVKLGIEIEEIYSALNAAAARKYLTDRKFDLLMLDLNLPTRDGSSEAASAEVGLELLRQIVEDRDIPAPGSIVGITSNLASMVKFSDQFHKLTTQILLIDPENNEWRYSLNILIGRIRNGNSKAYDFDICVITALREPEQSEILKFPFNWSPEESLGNGVLARRGKLMIDGIERRIVIAHSPQMGLVAATFLTNFLIEYFRPRLLFMTGICGGIGDKPKLGDVIIAEKSWDWQSGKWLEDGAFEIAPDPKDASPELVALALGVKEMLTEYHNEFPGVRPPQVPTIINGPMVSGSAVVADAKMHARFVIQHRKSVGVDMECYGVYFSAQMSQESKPLVLCLKAVSDLANRSKTDNIQEYCSYISARVAFEVANRFFKSNR